jgi:DNA-binding winged helix-turn-helix (wHTH) protein
METRPQRLRFDRYVLDLNRGCLFLGKNEISVRPKTFAILRHLVENPSRLVSKDELFAAVWPNLAITDDVLVQSIGELRRALGDDGARLIRTFPAAAIDLSRRCQSSRPLIRSRLMVHPLRELSRMALIRQSSPPGIMQRNSSRRRTQAEAGDCWLVWWSRFC